MGSLPRTLGRPSPADQHLQPHVSAALWAAHSLPATQAGSPCRQWRALQLLASLCCLCRMAAWGKDGSAGNSCAEAPALLRRPPEPGQACSPCLLRQAEQRKRSSLHSALPTAPVPLSGQSSAEAGMSWAAERTRGAVQAAHPTSLSRLSHCWAPTWPCGRGMAPGGHSAFLVFRNLRPSLLDTRAMLVRPSSCEAGEGDVLCRPALDQAFGWPAVTRQGAGPGPTQACVRGQTTMR